MPLDFNNLTTTKPAPLSQPSSTVGGKNTFPLANNADPVDFLGLVDDQALNDLIFGTAPSAEFKSLTTLTPEQQTGLSSVLNLLFSSGNPEGFGGELTAGLSNLQQTSLEGLEQNALALASGSTPTQQLAIQALEGLLNPNPTDFQDFFQSSVVDPALATFNEQILPSIGAKNAKNFFSSGRLTQEELATEDLLDSLTAQASEFAFATQESAQNRTLQALGLVDTVTGAPIDQAIKLLEAGQIPQQIEQAGLTAEYTEFLRVQQEKALRIEQILGALNVQGVENIGIGLGGQEGLLGGLIGGGGGSAIGGAIGGIFSSRELKEDIVPLSDDEILQALEDIDLHTWRYKGDTTTHMGPMAEDFQETFKVGDGKTIHLADVMGITLASNKALARKIDALMEAA